MYQYNEEIKYDPNASMQNQTVPNVMMDETQNTNGVMLIQQGVMMPDTGMNVNMNGAQQQTIPIYAVDPAVPCFDIPDPIIRRAFAVKVFTLLLLQNIIALPVIEIFLLCFNEPISVEVYGGIGLLSIPVLLLMYIFSDARRNSPMNIILFALTTIIWAVQEGLYATFIDSQIAIISQLIIIIQLIFIIIYAKQTRFRFTNINAIFLIVLVFIACVFIVTFFDPLTMYGVTFGSALNVIYFVYDMQLMLSGHHGYNLQPEEHIFAAVNIYADIPNLLWRFFRYLFLDHFIRMYRFLVSCCWAEVC